MPAEAYAPPDGGLMDLGVIGEGVSEGISTLERPPLDRRAMVLQPTGSGVVKEEGPVSSAGADTHRRVRLGAGADTPPELLYFLACDPSLEVRAAVAMNPAAPRSAAQQLVRDADAPVRMVLARKLAGLTPALGASDQARLSAHAWDSLAILVGDAVEKVRASVAELVSDMDAAPRALILRLAADADFSVSDPVLRLSPVLTEEDLVGLVADSASPRAACSIARRVNLTEAVSDAIVRRSEREAIAALLGNPSAAIRESTIDALVVDAAAHEEWQEPLVRRPQLSPRNARLLGSFVAEQLVRVLSQRPDLDGSVVGELHARLEQMMAAPSVVPDPDEAAFAEAEALARAGGVSEQHVIDAIRSGDARRVDALLAVAAGVPLAAVRRAAKLRSCKAVVSLIWKAGFSMRIAGPLQSMLCDLTPAAMLRGTTNNGYPLTVEEMRWQLEFVVHR